MRSARLASSIAVAALSMAGAQAYDVVEVEDGGGLTGTVRMTGKAPAIETTLIAKDNHVCGEGNAVMNPVTVDGENGLADAVVTIEGVKAGKAWPDDVTPEIVQADCAFSPYVQVMPKTAKLSVVNEDPLLHNIHAYEIIGRARRTLFNIAQPTKGQIDTNPLKLRRGHVVEVACDAHNWMSAWVVTSEHPYSSVTAKDGSFSIEGIPAGRYEVTVWHPTLGSTSSEITIEAGSAATLDVALAGDET